MSFSIGFEGVTSSENLALGRIRLGEFSEIFWSNLSYWDRSDYRRSWADAVDVVESAEHAVSCLVTSMVDPSDGNFVVCLPLFRDGDAVFVQNSLIMLDQLENAFDPHRPWCAVRPRSVVSEDGRRVSEWAVDLASLGEWARSR
ncbi:hypothetical protein [Allokutzneria albata]|uniref:CdiI C-terminal domain-containing protein n=1 Tax=Allokutzneria albata TaxID=211114 RepID=A0A1G9V6D5_ALLAB|nr:hypothetical protein [Allokutzneria albata]SDM67627.1 hypothetical protein SAMN04489726_2853 [Allokutzneria albata]